MADRCGDEQVFEPAHFGVPDRHQPAMAVPKGGSSCASCRFYSRVGGEYGSCSEPNYERYYSTTLIPCAPDAFCSDWYEQRDARADAINLPQIAARLRAHANEMHRTRAGGFRRGHPFRARPPRQTSPAAQIAAYAADIKLRVSRSIATAIRPLLERLPALVAGHAAAVRADIADGMVRSDAGEVHEAERLFQSAESAVRARLGPVLTNEMARRHADAIGRKNAHQLGAQLKALVGTDVPVRARAEQAIFDQFAVENVRLIGGLANETMDAIAKRVVRGLGAGDSAEDIADDIRERLGVSDSRAELIARDQLGKLQGQLNHARQQELGITHYVWRHGASKDPRPEHEARDGNIYEYGELDEEPGQAISCSCWAEPVVDPAFVGERDEE